LHHEEPDLYANFSLELVPEPHKNYSVPQHRLLTGRTAMKMLQLALLLHTKFDLSLFNAAFVQ
jgi:hypothetical protein